MRGEVKDVKVKAISPTATGEVEGRSGPAGATREFGKSVDWLLTGKIRSKPSVTMCQLQRGIV